MTREALEQTRQRGAGHAQFVNLRAADMIVPQDFDSLLQLCGIEGINRISG